MLKALAIKELRESLLVLAIGALAMAWAVGYVSGFSILPNWIAYPLGFYGGGGRVVPFVSSGFVYYSAICMGGLAIGLGLKQSAWEDMRDTYYFLLHRPISRREIFATKLVVGIVAILAIYTVAILVHGWWGATLGTHGGPFEWSMLLSAWRLMLVLPVLYLGAFVSGLRPAHWFGTRLAPLVAAIVWSMLISAVPFWSVAIVMFLIACVFAVVAIAYFSAERDF